MTTLTYEHNGETIELELKDSYELVYVDYRDQLTDEQVAMIVRGDHDALWDNISEFESESQYSGAEYEADQLLADAIEDDEEFEHREDLIDAIRERDSSNVIGMLAGQTPAVLLRIKAIDEDHAFSFEQVTPEQVLAAVGFPLPATERNYRTIDRALAECSYGEYGVLMGYWVVGADVSDLYALPRNDEDSEVEIANPYLYLGNPFAGSGWVTEDALEGTVRVKRSDLRTDKDAFGYSLDEVFGGLNASSFTAEIKAVPANATTGVDS